MPSFSSLIFATALAIGSSSYAAIDCKPGMGNCPGSGYPGDPTPPPPSHADTSPYLAIGYAEIPSPDCNPADHAKARAIAKSDATQMAQDELGTKVLVELPGSFFSESCEQGFYAESAPGLSWIVQYFAHFEK